MNKMHSDTEKYSDGGNSLFEDVRRQFGEIFGSFGRKFTFMPMLVGRKVAEEQETDIKEDEEENLSKEYAHST
jgi:hypothetical protein